MSSSSTAQGRAGHPTFNDADRGRAPAERSRPALAASIPDVLRVRFELLVLGALFLLTGAFGRSFSKLELGFSWLHPTEVALGIVLIVALARTRPAEWLTRLRATRVIVPLLILWVFGAIATARGLDAWGFSLVLHDIGLVEYSLLVPIMIIVVRDRADFLWLCGAIALSGLLGMIVYALTWWTPLQWDLANDLNLIAPAIGMYLGIYVAWVLSRSAVNEPVRPWQYASVVLAIALVIMGLARSAWFGCLAAIAVVLLFAPAGRRRVFTALVVGLVVGGVALSIPAGEIRIGEPPSHPAGTTGDGGFDDSAYGRGVGVVNEVSTSFGSSAQSANSSWRLAYWRYLLDQSADRPVFGVGFGQPASFKWRGTYYDRRTGDPRDPFDVTNPHNSFVDLIYRTGWPGFLALLAILGVAVARLFRLARSGGGADRATAIWLLAGLVAATVVANFTVALEGPFMGIFFWGLLALGLTAPQFLGREPQDADASPSPAV